jgi:hypothetical protein
MKLMYITHVNTLSMGEITISQLVRKFPAFCGTQRPIAVFIIATGHYTEAVKFRKIHCNVILPSTPRSSIWVFLLFRLSDEHCPPYVMMNETYRLLA